MRRVLIKPGSPQLKGNIERSHRTEEDEFYQLLSLKDDVDFGKNLETWEKFKTITHHIQPMMENAI
ncbi:hypothetical protein [Draconibacterium sediminis]|uniref:hypothetical protein n=1 Tax=Draconibacterium sediminis TaxID=1544798 RepID=UPI0009E5C1F6|nr:hypothetical protein [Draconibacterium sediminis]